MKTRELLEKENTQLKKELIEQWMSNHAEHCQRNWPHKGICKWSIPLSLSKETPNEILTLLSLQEAESESPHLISL
jgi:hypothetical protein